MDSVKSGKRTLILSILMSATGPIVLGISAFLGQSSTQYADLIRRTTELIAMIVSYYIYNAVNKEDGSCDIYRKAQLESVANKFIGIAMIFSGVIMIAITILSKTSSGGNVLPALLIAVQGVAVNGLFWKKYRKLNIQNPDAIMDSQSNLYRAKTYVDCCVLIALLFVAIIPNSPITAFVDKAGSILVSVYLAFSGISILKKTRINEKNKDEI